MNSRENNIPSGTVTFLFTDIAGSTKLSQMFPDKLPSALEKHNSILIKQIISNNGFIFQNVGDAFCCAFGSSADAVKAAADIQINLANEKWDEVVINVRIGIHSGNAEWNGTNYTEYITLARVSRVMSAACGGQILISNDAFELYSKDSCVQSKEEDEKVSSVLQDYKVEFRDLGVRRLKDIILPIRLYQVVGAGLREDFPPLATLDARPNNIPVQLTSFIGRESEMKHVKETLKLSRLVTLTSAGGSGKTRLALQTAADVIDEYECGVWFVDLAALNDPALLTSTIIDVLGVKEETKKSTERTLIDFLREKEILILLDNCEQLIDACAGLTEKLLSSCPKLKIIATSREALNCNGEVTYRIPPLTIPDIKSNHTPEQLNEYESVRLFIERALLVNPGFIVSNENASALAEICSRLDGIPLAIELAAARTKILSIEKINGRLDDRFSLLTEGKRTALPRQQTLRALIDWSYDLLSEEEKTLWSRLSIFSGGWTLEAAEKICSDSTIDESLIFDLLTQLTEKSVIIFDESKDRYRILESIRQYGIERLSDGYEIFLRHLNYFLELSERAEPELRGDKAKLWLERIEADHSNFISAIDWSVNNGNAERGGIVAAAIGEFWSTMGHYSTGIRLVETILQSSGVLDMTVKSKMLSLISALKKEQGYYEQAKKYLEESLVIRKEIGDNHGIVISLVNLGSISFHQGDYELAKKYFEESLAMNKGIGDKKVIAASMTNLGNISYYQGDYEQAREYYKECLAISKEIGYKKLIAISLNSLGSITYVLENSEQAREYYTECLAVSKEIGFINMVASSINNLGFLANNQGDYELARKYYYESMAMSKEVGDKRGIATSMGYLGNTLSSLGDHEQAENYYKECLSIYSAIGDRKGIADTMHSLGGLMYTNGDIEQAKTYFEESLDVRKELGDRKGIADTMHSLGDVMYTQGDFEQAMKYFKESLAFRKEIGDKPGVASTLIHLARLLELNNKLFDAARLLYAAEHTVKSMGTGFDSNAEKEKDELTARLNELLSDAEISICREEGENMTFEEACELAMRC